MNNRISLNRVYLHRVQGALPCDGETYYRLGWFSVSKWIWRRAGLRWITLGRHYSSVEGRKQPPRVRPIT